MLLVHDTLVLTEFETYNSCNKQDQIIDPFGLPSISMKKLVLASKGKALELKTVEEVERNETGNGSVVKLLDFVRVNRVDVEAVDGDGSHCQNAEIEKEAFEALVVRFSH